MIMKKGFLLLIVFLCSFLSIAQQKNLDAFFENLATQNKAMGSISIYKNGKNTYSKHIGFKDFSKKNRANNNTKYRIGSITKTFTATIMLQLIDEGKLTLNTKLSSFFPKLPNASKITIENLLRHQSGLTNITQSDDIRSWIEKTQTRKQMINRFIKNGTQFEPGKKSEYSNTNYVILSYIAEILDKKSFKKILDSRIIKPLKLKRTEFGKSINTKNNEAHAYYFNNNQWNLITMQTHMSAPMGAGAVVSTPSDLNIFYTNLFLGKLISKSSLNNLMKIKKGFGIGVTKFSFKGLEIYGHDGGIDGFQSFALYIPERKISMAFTFNGLQSLMMPLVVSILDKYFENDSSLKRVASITLKPEDLKKYLGVYSGKTFPAKVNFTNKGNILFAEATGQPVFELTAVKKDRFIYDAMGIQFDFNPQNETLELTFSGNKHLLKKENKEN